MRRKSGSPRKGNALKAKRETQHPIFLLGKVFTVSGGNFPLLGGKQEKKGMGGTAVEGRNRDARKNGLPKRKREREKNSDTTSLRKGGGRDAH